LAELLKDDIRDPGLDLELRVWIFRHYGTAGRAVYTLFEVTLAGCWPNYFRPLIERVNAWYVVFSVVYITLVVFAIIRIISPIFLKETLHIASNDAEMMINEQVKKKEVYIKKLESVFEAVDTRGEGTLRMNEFEAIVMNPSVRTWLQVLELEIHDAEALFHMFDDGDGEVTYEEFLKGVMRMKGQARSIDCVSIMRTSDAMQRELHHIRNQQDTVFELQKDIHEWVNSRTANPASQLQRSTGAKSNGLKLQ